MSSKSQKKIAFIIQRYGRDINGGAEAHCRLIAEKLSHQHNVTILTTCAIDYTTWKQEYPQGTSKENNITIIRFTNEQRGSRSELRYIRHKLTQRSWYHYIARLLGLFSFLNSRFSSFRVSKDDNLQWLKKQGPYSPELVRHLQTYSNHYDAFIFFSCLYYTTAVGVQQNSSKSILVPTLHNEKASYYPVYKSVMNAPEWILYNSLSEKKLAEKIFNISHKKNLVAGVGIELPTFTENIDILSKYKITAPYIIYIGRVEKNKGCAQLISFFKKFKNQYNYPLLLVIVGKSFMKLPEDKNIINTGFISDEDKQQLLLQSQLLVMPSKYESLSMVVLESFYYSKPVIVNEHCEVLKNQVELSNAGFYYKNFPEFAQHLHALLNNEDLSAAKGANGKKFVSENYSWEAILNKYNSALSDIASISPEV
jgi:glycosyltransferase involved in cell wall biosynthesis